MRKITSVAIALLFSFILSAQDAEYIDKACNWGELSPVLFYHNTIVHGEWLYKIGGQNRYGSDSIARWKLTAGVPSAPVVRTVNTPFGNEETISSAASVIENNTIYIIGGRMGVKKEKDFTSKTVWYAKIKEDGSFEEFKKAVSLPDDVLAGGGAVVLNGAIYYIGGFYTRTVVSARINEDGSLDKWMVQQPLPANAAVRDGICAVNGRIYVTGVSAYNVGSDRIYSAKPEDDGSIKKWQRVTNLPTKGYRSILAPEKDCLLYFDGIGGKIYRSSVEKEGMLGDWEEAGAMPVRDAIDFTITRLPDGRYFYFGGLCRSKPPQFPGNTVIQLKGFKK